MLTQTGYARFKGNKITKKDVRSVARYVRENYSSAEYTVDGITYQLTFMEYWGGQKYIVKRQTPCAELWDRQELRKEVATVPELEAFFARLKGV